MQVPQVHYHETQVGLLEHEGKLYTLVHSAEGYRLWHFGEDGKLYCEWPTLQHGRLDQPVVLRWAVYAFNGLRSSERPNETLPKVATEWVREHLLKGRSK